MVDRSHWTACSVAEQTPSEETKGHEKANKKSKGWRIARIRCDCVECVFDHKGQWRPNSADHDRERRQRAADGRVRLEALAGTWTGSETASVGESGSLSVTFANDPA
jgi:hypothetical protein